jgi:hypothetical protein
MDAGGSVEDDIGDTNACDLRDPRPGVVQEREQEVIAPRYSALPGLAEDGEHLLVGEEVEHRLLEALHY